MKAINLTPIYPKEINWFLRDKIQNIFLKKHHKSANYLKILISLGLIPRSSASIF